VSAGVSNEASESSRQFCDAIGLAKPDGITGYEFRANANGNRSSEDEL
jgi:hypothetical protein